MGFADDYCNKIKRFRFAVFIVWFIVIILGLKYASSFTEATTSQYTSAHDSDSAVAQRNIAHHFPVTKDSQIITLFLQVEKGQTMTENSFLNAIKSLELELYNEVSEKYDYVFNATQNPKAFVRSMQSYWLFEEYYGATELASSLVSTSGSSTIISVSYDSHQSKRADQLVNFLNRKTRDLIKSEGLSGMVSSGFTGIQPFADAILDGVEDDLHIMDMAVLPCALLILATIIRSFTLMIIPILNIAITILAEFTVMYPIALQMEVVSFTPSLMMSITIAMSIDYSLFLLSRFMEELKRGKTIEEAIPIMINGAGHTIIISGGTLVCCFLGMLIFPLAMLQSVGIGASVTLFFALTVNLTLTPAILYSFGHQLVACQDWIERTVCCASKPSNARSASRASNSKPNSGYLEASLLEEEDMKQREFSDIVLSASEDVEEVDRNREFEADEAMSKSVWYGLATNILKPKVGISVLVLTLCLCAPVCSYCFSVNTSIDFDMSVPSEAKTYDVFKSVEKEFGAGAVFPYKLLFVPKRQLCPPSDLCQSDDITDCEAGLMCNNGLTLMNEALEAIALAGDIHSEVAQYSGVTQLDGTTLTYADYQAAFIAQEQGTASSEQESMLLLYEGFCEMKLEGTEQTVCSSAYNSVVIAENPFSTEGTEWLCAVRKEIKSIQAEGNFDIYLGFGAGMSYDVSNSVYDAFPTIIIVTLSVVFVLMGLAFDSIVAPVRSVLTLALTLSFVYGLAVLVYQHGAFAFLGLRCLSDSNGISWLPPVMCFSIIVGLGLDYDVFLISRVFEFRDQGYTDHSAAVKGICSTGFIITAAGLIMAVAFGGLFTSTELILNQTAFLLVFAVLLDTFVVRTLCVPALLGLTDHLSWWPGIMTPPTKTIGF